MNYIIFKNINSNTIQGLIIQELPPITKPKMRTETIVIEGRDGDISEILGYSSYDKEIKIGLTRNYDIDEVIKYFSGKGEVVFSNEPNKYYNVEIQDQINFERLLKFKTASVRFHTQPYKYLVDEESVDVEITDQEVIQVSIVGLEDSKPIFILYGSGIVEISINNYAQFQVNIDDEYVVIDSEEQEAYKGSVLKNNQMTGVFPILNSGNNDITWTGNLERIIIIPKSRWL